MELIIIGAGLAGLSAGVYAQKCGFSSTVFEKHTVPGGQCTGWDRDGCHIDGCVDWLMGTTPGNDMNNVWVTTGALENTPILQRDCFNSLEFDGQTLHLWRDLSRLQADMLALAPEDSAEIKRFIRTLRSMKELAVPAKRPMDMMSPGDYLGLGLRMTGHGMAMGRYGKTSCGDYAKQFKSPLLQAVFSKMFPADWSAFAILSSLASFSGGNAGFPQGGSRAMAVRMAEKYRSLGGQLRLGTGVDEVLVENGRAAGVRLESGEEARADYVVSTCDADVTLNRLLKGQYQDEFFTSRYADPVNYPNPSCCYLAWRTDADLSQIPRGLIFECEPYRVGERSLQMANIKHYAYDATLNPPDKQLLVSYIEQFDKDFPYWEKLHEDKEAYRAEKQRLAEEVQRRVEERFPALKGHMVLLDVATPMTYVRYCGAYHGAYMSFMLTPGGSGFMNQFNGWLKGLEHFQISGQWTFPPGGTPGAVLSGKFSIQRICQKEGIPFVS